ncbi:Mbov_0400 family ICE element protein [Mesomycoplasma molare]|uniref:Uncharacterized protein n=1 Tax=Mesomycoplasma molare TaxID=171288 RepID=A0ABY5TUZ6_9BACT|nr:hypothetical protein [Mesomycoplasma molare]UWD34488.1 hypothetical protein NX772_01500 [Mesomycoplasma molare]
MSKIDKFKPFFTENEKLITFDRFENTISHRPVVIFYDCYRDSYFYLKLRTATISKPNGIGLKKKTPGEVLIKKSTQKGSLLKNDSYIDTTQLFQIKAQELESIVNTKNVLYLNTYYFQWDIVRTILLEVEKNLSYEPPKVSLVNVEKEGENFKGTTLYCHKDLWFYDKSKLDISEQTKIEFLEKEILENRNNDFDLKALFKNLKLGVRDELFEQSSWDDSENEEESLEQESEEDFGMTM